MCDTGDVATKKFKTFAMMGYDGWFNEEVRFHHKCSTPLCVNPKCLYQGTKVETEQPLFIAIQLDDGDE